MGSMEEQSAGQYIDAIILDTPDWRGEMLAHLRRVMMHAGADLHEEIKWRMPSRPEGSPVWTYGGKNICVANILKATVRLNFPTGIPDPKRLFNARLESSVVRAIDYHEGDVVDESALAELVRDAIALTRGTI